jgi:hypothetical protein
MDPVIIGPDIQEQLCPFLYEGTLAPIIDRGLEIPEADETGHVIASIRTPKALSVLALTCKTFHIELQKHRNLQLRLLAQKFIDVSPEHGLELVNVDAYDPPDFSQAMPESILLWRVFLGSRLHLVMSLMRQTVEDSEVAEQRLVVQIGTRHNLIGAPQASARLVVEPHALCYKSGYDFNEGSDNEQYDEWYETSRTQVHQWLIEQYHTLCAPLV